MTHTEPPVLAERPWSLTRLKPLPPVAVQLMRMISDPDCPFERMAALIRADAAFSSEVLRIANSPLFGFRGRVESIFRALMLLGVERLKSLVVTVALRNFLRSSKEDTVLRRCWRHSLACACASETLAKAADMLGEASVYTAGLLHDIGRLGLLASYPTEYARMLDVDDECGLDILKSERDIFEIDHCQAGSWLSREWGLPPEFEVFTSRHHEEPEPDGLDRLKIVQLACLISDAVGFGAVPHSKVSFAEIRTKLPRQVDENLGPEDEFIVSIGEKATALERDLLI